MTEVVAAAAAWAMASITEDEVVGAEGREVCVGEGVGGAVGLGVGDVEPGGEGCVSLGWGGEEGLGRCVNNSGSEGVGDGLGGGRDMWGIFLAMSSRLDTTMWRVGLEDLGVC